MFYLFWTFSRANLTRPEILLMLQLMFRNSGFHSHLKYGKLFLNKKTGDAFHINWYSPYFWNILLMEENPAPVEVGSLSHHLQGFIHPMWLFGISSIHCINSCQALRAEFQGFILILDPWVQRAVSSWMEGLQHTRIYMGMGVSKK